ncbi:MAG: hypothetical protein EOO03_18180, partial [Chitinophagaceae bacterium]
MSRITALLAAFTLLFVSTCIDVAAQDSTNAITGWKVESRKAGEGVYELQFNLPSTSKWQVYAPNQVLLDIKTTELQFADSAVQQQGQFMLDAAPQQVSSPIFENTKIAIYEGAVSWKAVIRISGTVPAKLQGTLLYTYGRNSEFYPST